MSNNEIPPYLPHFIFKYWLSDIFSTRQSPDDQRFHIYDVHNNDLAESRRLPQETRNIFEGLVNQENMDEHCRTILYTAMLAFSRLEAKAELAFEHLMQQILSSQNRTKAKPLPMEQDELDTLRRFFVFIRFRNSVQYGSMLSNLTQTATWEKSNGPSMFHHIRRHRAFASIHAFLVNGSIRQPISHVDFDDIDRQCWNLLDAEICLGIASDGQEFVMTDNCIGNLDESFRDDPDSCRFFVPLSPTVAIYILGDTQLPRLLVPTFDSKCSTIEIECGLESVSDVHLRNAILLQNCPHHIYFSNLLSVARTINLYEIGSRGADEHSDYSRLKHRCQQKATQEEVTKTLVVKGSVSVTDLTDHVIRVGDSPVGYGSFSDVWKGIWTIQEPFEEAKHRTVALKYLRQIMAENVRTKLINRIQDEIVAWHALRHPNIAQLFGIIQSSNNIAMISPWCANGNLISYLKEVNPSANRLELLVQIASGVSYLHNFKPVVVHGDLKGCNVLVDDLGNALITDFGLAKVIEEFSDSMQPSTSFFAGSTRWMAPELIFALVEDDACSPPITTASDVYAFACVCLEIATGEVPFPHRTNDHAVTVDIMRGVRPSRGVSCRIRCRDEEDFWLMLRQCWDSVVRLRPSMTDMTAFLKGQTSLLAGVPRFMIRRTPKY